MKRLETVLFFLCMAVVLWSQNSVNLSQLPQEHPRYLTTPQGKDEAWKLIENESWAKDVFEKLKQRTDKYTERTESQPDWLLSRLAMYWTSHATDVYIKGEVFDHAGGAKAPVPTVRYTGTRGTVATYGRPRLEDVKRKRGRRRLFGERGQGRKALA